MAHYLSLVHDIHHGSPIGTPLLLMSTTIFPNLPSACLMPNIVTEYINEEVALAAWQAHLWKKRLISFSEVIFVQFQFVW